MAQARSVPQRAKDIRKGHFDIVSARAPAAVSDIVYATQQQTA